MISLPGYTLTDKFHDGVETAIYRGVRDSDQKPILAKLLKADPPSPRSIAKLCHEHAILCELDISGVVKPLGLEQTGQSLALLMESVDATPLSELLQKKKLHLESILQLAISLTKILGALHQHTITHKDLKPQNILYNPATRIAYLAEFGIAARLSHETQEPASPSLLDGTLAYLSPEQTGLMNRAIDHRSDFYSLGVTLYEALTGVPPFSAAEPAQLVYSHIARTPVPPHERLPALPRMLSVLVLKLLSKQAEDRYQDAAGLGADLEECLQQWKQKRRINEFQLGQHDRASAPRIPQRLYGRQVVSAEMLAAFQRMGQGPPGVLLITGAPGTGKSTLARELHKSIAQVGGSYAAASCDPLDPSTPYAPITRALTGLIRRILGEPEEVVSQWRDQILGAIGQNGQLIIELIPELQQLIGPQQKVSELGPAESQSRFKLVFQNFVRVFGTRRYPLVLMLDELQWADPASLQLLGHLLEGSVQRKLVLVGTVSDSQVTPAHLFNREMTAWRNAGITIHSLALTPLTDGSVHELVKDALGSDTQKAAPLAEWLNGKARGNPLFTVQLLTRIQEEHLLQFDLAKQSWTWDAAQLEREQTADHIGALLVDRLRKLPAETQRLLTLAAYLGPVFELRSLLALDGSGLEATCAALWPGLRAGLLVPLDPEYRFLPTQASGVTHPAIGELSARVSFRFFHNQMRQAARDLLPVDRRPEVHLAISRFLLSSHREAPHAAKLFDAVNRLNDGVTLITDPAERLQLLRMNLLAAQQAKNSMAYFAAATYCRHASELLEEAWKQDHELCFQVYEARAECEYLSGDLEQAEKHFDLLLTQARSDLERARIYIQRLSLCPSGPDEGLMVGQQALRIFGIELPTSPAELADSLRAEMKNIEGQLGGRTIASLLDAPPVSDARVQALMQLLMALRPHALLRSPVLAQLLVAKQVSLSISHGSFPGSSFAYATHAAFVASELHQYRSAGELGELAVKLSERFDDLLLRGRSSYIFGSFISFLGRPAADGLADLRRSLSIGSDVGDTLYASDSCVQIVLLRLALGEELDAVRVELGQLLVSTQRMQIEAATACLGLARQFIAALEKHTASKTRLDDRSFDEVTFLNRINKERLFTASFVYYQLKLRLFFLYDDYVSAIAMAQEAEQREVFVAGSYSTVEASLYTALAILGLLRNSDNAQRAQYQEQYQKVLDKHTSRLELLARACAPNFQHQLLLIQAEQAILADQATEAMKLYEQAIELSQQSGFVSHAALAYELAGKFYLRLGLSKFAGIYISQAHSLYIQWGALAKASQLADRYGHMLVRIGDASSGSKSAAPESKGLSTRTIVGGLFDISALMRATQSISMEIMLDKVLDQVLRIVLTTAGAQRAFLILVTPDKGLVVAAATGIDQEHVEVGMNRVLEEEPNLAKTIVQHVAHTSEVVLLVDAVRDSRFSQDPYVMMARPKSLLCMAMVHQGRPIGVIYLENNLAVGAFRSDRTELLRMLCSQAAIAVDNAMLYSRVQAISDQLRRSNEDLSQTNGRLLAVTSQLEQSNGELSQVNKRLELELEERIRAEQVQVGLQNTIIQNQRARLDELSTPLIPLGDKIMILPLIGTVDKERAEQVLETVLQGSAIHRPDFVVIDITGMRHVDTSAANSLLQAAAALRLLGTEAILTGVRAEVAQTLVSLGIDLKKIITRNTLGNGIAYARSRSGAQRKNEV